MIYKGHVTIIELLAPFGARRSAPSPAAGGSPGHASAAPVVRQCHAIEEPVTHQSHQVHGPGRPLDASVGQRVGVDF